MEFLQNSRVGGGEKVVGSSQDGVPLLLTVLVAVVRGVEEKEEARVGGRHPQ